MIRFTPVSKITQQYSVYFHFIYITIAENITSRVTENVTYIDLSVQFLKVRLSIISNSRQSVVTDTR